LLVERVAQDDLKSMEALVDSAGDVDVPLLRERATPHPHRRRQTGNRGDHWNVGDVFYTLQQTSDNAVEDAVSIQLRVEGLVNVGELVGQVRSVPRPQPDRAAAANHRAAWTSRSTSSAARGSG
jgi:hypothetical protein